MGAYGDAVKETTMGLKITVLHILSSRPILSVCKFLGVKIWWTVLRLLPDITLTKLFFKHHLRLIVNKFRLYKFYSFYFF